MVSQSAGRVRVEDSPKRVRVLFAGKWIADTVRAKLVWEIPYYPTYYLPQADVRTGLLVDTGEVEHSPSRGDARLHTVKVGKRTADRAAAWFTDSKIAELKGHVRLGWDAMDAWFEEEEEVYVHARDPYKRIDVLHSTRHVRVDIDGVTVAESDQPRLLFETGLPTRYYLPKPDVDMHLLVPSRTRTHCPYKGTASYYSIQIGDRLREDLAWWYQHPTLESVKIAGAVCFYNEKVDLHVDGEHLPRPRTPFS